MAVVKGFQSEIKHKVVGFGSHIQITKNRFSRSFEQEPIRFDTALMNKIDEMPEVKHVQPFATKPGIMKSDKAIEGIILKGVSTDYDWSFLKSRIVKGKIIKLNDSSVSNDILISKNIAHRLQIDTGQDVIVFFVQYPTRVRKFRIAGIYETGMEEVDKYFAVCDLKQIRTLNKWDKTQIGGYEILLYDLNKISEVNEKVRYLIDIYEDTRTIQELFPQIFDWLSLLDMNVLIILILMGIVAGINMITALLIMILERTQLIGLLKSVGATNWSIQKIFIYSAMLLIGIGIILGNGLALFALLLQDKFGIITLPQESYYVSHVPISFQWFSFFLINLGTFLLCSLMMIIPSFIISKIIPVKSLRLD